MENNCTHPVFTRIDDVFEEYYANTDPRYITEHLKDSIISRSAYAVADGSFHPDKLLGTACWIITDDRTKIRGTAQAPGTGEEMEAYRAELFGLYCLLFFINLYCDYYQIDNGEVEIACNCLGSISKGLLNEDRPKVTQKHHDLLLAIFYLRQSSPITLKFLHVYGHQDASNKTLDKWELLNCACDTRAKCMMAMIDSPLPNEKRCVESSGKYA